MQVNRRERIFALDVFRGLAIFLMILVDAPPANTYEILKHAKWEGLTLADLAFPGFVFAMGASAAVSTSRKVLTWDKLFRRAVLLFVLGIIFNEIGYVLAYIFDENFTGTNFYENAVEHLRLFGILQRLALTYALGMVITKFVTSGKGILTTAFALLIASSLGFHLYAAENPFDKMNNISGAVDLIFPTANHMLTPIYDPEGLYGTIATTASFMFGFLAGRILVDNVSLRDKIYWLGIFCAGLLVAGGAWSFFDIIAKNIWTTPFALLTSGGNLILMAIFLFVFDRVPIVEKIFQPLTAMGRNPLFLFLASNFALMILFQIYLGYEIFGLLQGALQGLFVNESIVVIFCVIWAAIWAVVAELLYFLGIVIKL